MEASAPWAGGPAALHCAVHASNGDASPARIERWYRDDAPVHLPSPAPGTELSYIVIGVFEFVALSKYFLSVRAVTSRLRDPVHR